MATMPDVASRGKRPAKLDVMEVRDYTFLGTTQSLCPECLTLLPAKIIGRDGRVYFRKMCPTHGEREDFVAAT